MRVVLTGASGQLGAYLLEALIGAGHEVSAWSGRAVGERCGIKLRPVELTDKRALEAALASDDPEVVIHAGAISAAEAVRRDPERGRAVNVGATLRLADWCAERDRRLVFTSTDLVFDGSRPWWREDDPANPILEYGRTKRAAEPSVLAVPRGLVARVSLLYGFSRCGRDGFFDRAINALRSGEPQVFFNDEFRTPLDYASAAAVLVNLAGSDVTGVLHVGGRERVSRYDLMRRAAAALGHNTDLVRTNSRADVVLPEPRPADVSLDTSRLAQVWPEWEPPNIEQALRTSRGA